MRMSSLLILIVMEMRQVKREEDQIRKEFKEKRELQMYVMKDMRIRMMLLGKRSIQQMSMLKTVLMKKILNQKRS